MIYYIYFSEMGGVRGGMLDLSSSIAKFGSEKRAPLFGAFGGGTGSLSRKSRGNNLFTFVVGVKSACSLSSLVLNCGMTPGAVVIGSGFGCFRLRCFVLQ